MSVLNSVLPAQNIRQHTYIYICICTYIYVYIYIVVGSVCVTTHVAERTNPVFSRLCGKIETFATPHKHNYICTPTIYIYYLYCEV